MQDIWVDLCNVSAKNVKWKRAPENWIRREREKRSAARIKGTKVGRHQAENVPERKVARKRETKERKTCWSDLTFLLTMLRLMMIKTVIIAETNQAGESVKASHRKPIKVHPTWDEAVIAGLDRRAGAIRKARPRCHDEWIISVEPWNSRLSLNSLRLSAKFFGW